jgi:hypothetical protein
MKMKLNRSLKELKVQHHRFNDENPVLQKFNINIISPVHGGGDNQISLETVAKELNHYQGEENNKHKLKEAKMHKYTQSQTRLDIPVIKYIPVSPR